MKELSLLFEGLRGYATRDFPSGFLEGSLYKSPLFHGSDYDLREGETLQPQFGSEWGIYLSPNARYAKKYGKYLYEVYVNISNPYSVENKGEISSSDLTEQDVKKIRFKGYDSITSASEIVVFDPKKVHVFTRR